MCPYVVCIFTGAFSDYARQSESDDDNSLLQINPLQDGPSTVQKKRGRPKKSEQFRNLSITLHSMYIEIA